MHPFTTRRGRALRQRVLERDLFTCQMCGVILGTGRQSFRAAVVDHIRPISLSPGLAWDESNLQAVCRDCHAICIGIEKRLAPDAEAIEQAKREACKGPVNVYDTWA